MSKKSYLQYAVAAAFAVASAASNVAFAQVTEKEAIGKTGANDTPALAEQLDIPSGSVEVWGVIGTASTGAAALADVDFYSFDAGPGSVVTIDIDNGQKAPGMGRSVDTLIGVFDSSLKLLQSNDDVSKTTPVDTGSLGSPNAGVQGRFDAYLPDVLLAKGGRYYVGVTSGGSKNGVPRNFVDGGGLNFSLTSPSNGMYKLLISGKILPNVQPIDISIKPGSGDKAPVNPKSRGNIPVALLSSADFDALKVDATVDSLTFGGTGDEKSLIRCNKNGEDVDGDGRLDLVCHFDNQAANLTPGALEAHLKGQWQKAPAQMMPIEGHGSITIVGAEPKE